MKLKLIIPVIITVAAFTLSFKDSENASESFGNLKLSTVKPVDAEGDFIFKTSATFNTTTTVKDKSTTETIITAESKIASAETAMANSMNFESILKTYN
jgi:hypothetical protein